MNHDSKLQRMRLQAEKVAHSLYELADCHHEQLLQYELELVREMSKLSVKLNASIKKRVAIWRDDNLRIQCLICASEFGLKSDLIEAVWYAPKHQDNIYLGICKECDNEHEIGQN